MTTNIVDGSTHDPVLKVCPLCGAENICPLYHLKRYTPSFKVDRCNHCGFIFMNPRFRAAVISRLYDKEYFRGNAEYRYYDERDAERYAAYVWNKRIEFIHRFISQGNFLDIGAAFGGLLKTASRYYVPHGIELSDYAGSYARTLFGANMHIGTIDDHPFSGSHFSVITMIEVLEHLPDPRQVIKECCRLLVPGGLLVIQTANMDGFQARLLGDSYAYFMPGHLSYFTKANLTGLLRETGFQKVLAFHPVEFGLIPKLLKSRYDFKSVMDYRRWLRIAFYHYLSKLRWSKWAATSSMVLYAFR